MDHHIAKNSAGTFNVIIGWRARVAADQGNHFHVTNLSRIDGSTQGLEVRIIAALKSNHQSSISFIDYRKASLHTLKVKIHRFFTKDGFAGTGELFDQIRVGVGWGADDHRVDIVRNQNLLYGTNIAAISVTHGFGCLTQRIGDSHQLRGWY